MEELEDSIHQVIKSAVKAADFNRVMATVAKANKASETIVKGYEISKASIEAVETVKALMEKVEWQMKKLVTDRNILRDKYGPDLTPDDVWNGAFGEMSFKDILELDATTFREAIGRIYIQYYSDEYHAYPEMSPAPSRQTLPPPDSEQGFENLTESIRTALKGMELLDDTGCFSGKYKEVKALFNALRSKGLLPRISNTRQDEGFATYFEKVFGFRITGRTLRSPKSNEQEAIERDFAARLPKNKLE